MLLYQDLYLLDIPSRAIDKADLLKPGVACSILTEVAADGDAVCAALEKQDQLLGMLIRVLMQPLTDMGRAMQDIAQGEGDLTKRLKVTSNDEFGTLANAFNRFVERIHESIREVAGTARQLHDVAQLVVNASNSSMANSDEQSRRSRKRYAEGIGSLSKDDRSGGAPRVL